MFADWCIEWSRNVMCERFVWLAIVFTAACIVYGRRWFCSIFVCFFLSRSFAHTALSSVRIFAHRSRRKVCHDFVNVCNFSLCSNDSFRFCKRCFSTATKIIWWITLYVLAFVCAILFTIPYLFECEVNLVMKRIISLEILARSSETFIQRSFICGILLFLLVVCVIV